MGVPVVNLPPSIFWPAPPGLPAGAHVWVIGGSLAPAGVSCELVAADHVVPVIRHVVGAQRSPVRGPPGTPHQRIERLAPASALTANRQYQLRVRSASRTDIIGVWTVGAPVEAPAVTRCVLHDHHPHAVPGVPTHAPMGDAPPRFVELEVTATAIVEVRAGGDAAIEVIAGAGVIALGGSGPVAVRVLALDGAVVDERTLS